ncbi:MAG TPA: peptide deformylase [Bacteroidales bacterium]
MILPIISYGHSVLRLKGAEIDAGYPELENLITNMWETLEAADGSGLAAPQVNHAIRLFIVDSLGTWERMKTENRDDYFEGDTGIKETFINARITKYFDESWTESEGCLSIPTLSEDVERPWSITIQYMDRNFQKHITTFHGITARIIQHEYDHTEGKLYIDYLKPLTKRLLNGKLTKISKGQIAARYKMKFVK